MPKAENRKKPPSFGGQVPGRIARSQTEPVQRSTTPGHSANKKQELLEKMRSIQREHNK
ncbi:MAG: hypothetical protein K6T83_19510 [Alicyclobacillus sp.]|nr:hypothetical protein [Alicyclobacillus sp.]